MVISIPMPADSPFASKNISPERSQATNQFRTVEISPAKGKVERVKVRKSPNKKQSCKEVLGPRLDVITRQQVKFRQSFNPNIDVGDLTTRTHASSVTYTGH